LSGLRPGTYTVVSDLAGQRLPRWSQVAPAGGTYSVALSSGGASTGKNFANFLNRTTPIAANEWGTFQGGDMSLYTGLSWVNYGFASKFAGATTYVADSTYNGYLDWRLPTASLACGSPGCPAANGATHELATARAARRHARPW